MLSCMVRNNFKVNTWTLTTNKFKSRVTFQTKMSNAKNARWAFNVSAWNPTESEILAASSYIQKEEKQRISRYVFQNDAKSSLIGRLMLRKFVHISTSLPYNEITFGRDDHGKPYLLNAGDVSTNFNVSHQGDYVVLAGDTNKNIGIDVMKIEPPANKNIPEFFRIMTRQFSPHEWQMIRSFDTEMEMIGCFYRLWCLKESYVKNIGFGITVDLQQLSFSLKTKTLTVGESVTDTDLYERGVLKHDWLFEETLLDDKHAVAVSLQIERDTQYASVPYEFLSFEDLTKEAVPLFEIDHIFKNDFVKKELKYF